MKDPGPALPAVAGDGRWPVIFRPAGPAPRQSNQEDPILQNGWGNDHPLLPADKTRGTSETRHDPIVATRCVDADVRQTHEEAVAGFFAPDWVDGEDCVFTYPHERTDALLWAKKVATAVRPEQQRVEVHILVGKNKKPRVVGPSKASQNKHVGWDISADDCLMVIALRQAVKHVIEAPFVNELCGGNVDGETAARRASQHLLPALNNFATEFGKTQNLLRYDRVMLGSVETFFGKATGGAAGGAGKRKGAEVREDARLMKRLVNRAFEIGGVAKERERLDRAAKAAAALAVQKHFREFLGRRRVWERRKAVGDAGHVVQRVVRCYMARLDLCEARREEDRARAASVLQSGWRGFSCRTRAQQQRGTGAFSERAVANADVVEREKESGLLFAEDLVEDLPPQRLPRRAVSCPVFAAAVGDEERRGDVLATCCYEEGDLSEAGGGAGTGTDASSPASASILSPAQNGRGCRTRRGRQRRARVDDFGDESPYEDPSGDEASQTPRDAASVLSPHHRFLPTTSCQTQSSAPPMWYVLVPSCSLCGQCGQQLPAATGNAAGGDGGFFCYAASSALAGSMEQTLWTTAPPPTVEHTPPTVEHTAQTVEHTAQTECALPSAT